ncbi:Sulfite oxidase [Fulvia fulva]|uniref:Nitrate reductase [NADPH] n=1 Tax=Passalora fulva TaxID=5499 RepID=A0A9Q8PJA1_PASFU|nr:Sulfite oxidase [Fulvia fulva]KAK4612083.1 Sulfite oxidase [Fulvia fulva]UJO23571.1 Sulfite oxidase [Fulvia fulva]WPV20878.1 Sulfite oxidase [Fulvia fulva]WPV36542.1 Sulfite oxidase [Fulvia fulva]
MPPIRLQNTIGTPKRIAESLISISGPRTSARSLTTPSTKHVAQIAPGRCQELVWKGSRPRFPRRGVGTIRGTFHYARAEPQRAHAGGALALLFGASAIAVLAAPITTWVGDHVVDTKVETDAVHIDDGQVVAGIQKHRLADIAKHDEHSESKWVIHGTAVYDITEFVAGHPGGKVILRACGKSIDPFWKLFSIHNKPEVQKILDDFYIGEVDERDLNTDGHINWGVLGNDCDSCEDPFKDDPERDPELIVRTPKPFNAETPGQLLTDFLTPLRLFFVRHHLWVPKLEAAKHKLEIELSDGEEMAYSIDDLKRKFQQHTVTVTLQCAGNRRGHMNEAGNGKTSGLPWDFGAIGTAEFTGVRLRDVLLDSGYDVTAACMSCPDDPEADRHIHLCAPSDTYEQSIPLQTALNPASDVLLAWEMNGQPMPRDHGGPLRAIVPGSAATRSVKWVEKVRISCDESQSNWHSRDYKCFGPNVKAADLKQEDWDEAQSIQELPVQSAITNMKKKDDASVTLDGFAYSGGGRRIVRVDVSPDGGKTWRQACLRKDNAKGTRRWAWTLWNMEWPEDQLPKGDVEFVVKAVDEAHNCQPATFDGIWNFRGLLGNAWHRVRYSAGEAEPARPA